MNGKTESASVKNEQVKRILKVRKNGAIQLNATFIKKYGFEVGNAIEVAISNGKIVIEKK